MEFIYGILAVLGAIGAWLLGRGKKRNEKFWERVNRENQRDHQAGQRIKEKIEQETQELMEENEDMTHEEAVAVLRDRYGWGSNGNGNSGGSGTT